MGDLSWWPAGSGAGAGAPAAAGAPAGPGAGGAYAMGCIWGAAMMTGADPAICRLIRTFSSPSVISISPIPDSWTRSISFFSFRRSMASGLPRADVGQVHLDVGDPAAA